MNINTSKVKRAKLNIRKLVIYFVMLLLFFFLLIYSTRIVSLFIPNSVIKKNIDIELLKKDKVNYCFDSIEYYGDFLDSIYFAGWAFGETFNDNKEKEIWFVFESEESIYIFKNEVASSNIYKVFTGTYNIRGNNHRFYSTVSTTVMKNGFYKLYIYCKENDENYGLVDTGLMLKKDAKGISEYKWESTKTNISTHVEHLKAKSNLDSAITAEGYLQINGWSFVDGFDTTNQL